MCGISHDACRETESVVGSARRSAAEQMISRGASACRPRGAARAGRDSEARGDVGRQRTASHARSLEIDEPIRIP